MRLVDLVNQVQRRASEGANIIRYPFAAVYRQGRRYFQKWYENASLPGFGPAAKTQTQKPLEQPNGNGSAPSSPPSSRHLIPPPPPPPLKTPPPSTSPGTHSPAVPTGIRLPDDDDFFTADVATLAPPKPTFRPLLLPGETLQGGWWGRYLVRGDLINDGWMRLYEGIQENNQEAVWIHEYLLPEASFSLVEAEQRQNAFRQLINQNLQLGGGADFRLIKLKDVIPDVETKRRCFLITQPILDAEPLSSYLADPDQETMSPTEVRQFLFQVLQSLQYLHSNYRVRWLGEQSERGMVHGNLHLNSLWIRWDPLTLRQRDRHFFVYLSRFALWEHLCWPPDSPYPLKQIADHPQALGTVSQDLAALGRIGFYLLRGETVDADTDRLLQPEREEDWPQTPEAQALKPFIWKLMGLGERSFTSAEDALSQLRDWPLTAQPLAAQTFLEEEDEPEGAIAPSTSPWLWLGLGLLSILGLLVLWQRWPREQPILVERCEATCRMADVPIPPQTRSLRYGIEPDSSWTTAFYHFLADPTQSPPGTTPGQDNSPLQRLLEQRTDLDFQRLGLDALSLTNLPEQMIEHRLDAVLMQTDLGELPPNLKAQVVAYDAIVPFVVFSDASHDQSLPRRLKGQIRLEDLGKLFSGEPSSLGQEVQTYFPENETTVQLFKAQLQQAGLLSNSAAFDQLWQADQQRANLKKIERQPDNLYERMLVDFENPVAGRQIIGVGFDRLSRLLGQCSVYPLAVQTGGKNHSVLIQANGDPITPETDLCGDKGSYWVNSNAFTQDGYPLGYALSVVYPACESDDPCNSGAAFAAMLQSDEGQYLLSEVGLVPQQSIPHLRRILWTRP